MSSVNEIILSQFRETEIVEDLRSVFDVITRFMAIPLYMMFWLADWIYVPEYKWEFLFLRLLIVPICLYARYRIYKIDTAFNAQLVCAGLAGLVALPINVMIAYIPDVATNYYAGLNLVAIGGLSFLPLTMSFFVFGAVTIYVPYYLIMFYRMQSMHDMSGVLVNSFFIVGSIIVCFVIRNYHESLRLRELNLRLALNLEIAERTRKEISAQSKFFNH